MRSSLHEPSPASTYGETIAGDSIPATPQDVIGHGMLIADASTSPRCACSDCIVLRSYLPPSALVNT